MLKEEKSKDKPRVTVISLISERVDLLTITPKEEVEPNSIEVVEAEEIKESLPEKVEVLKAEVVFPKDTDIEHSIEPYRKKIQEIDMSGLIWKDTSDAVGIAKIKDTLSGLRVIRTKSEDERKTFNAPYKSVIDLSNSLRAKLVSEVKSLEEILKSRKKAFEDQQAIEKAEREAAKAAKLAEKEEQEKAMREEEERKKNDLISSERFKGAYGGILKRAAESKKKAEIYEKVNQEKPVVTDPLQVVEKPINNLSTDIDKINAKLNLMNLALDVDSEIIDPNIGIICSTIDNNLKKIIEYVNNKTKQV